MENIPAFLKLSREEQKISLEALVFASDESLPLKNIFNILVGYDNIDSTMSSEKMSLSDINKSKKLNQTTIEKEVLEKFNFSKDDIQNMIDEINEELFDTNRPYHIVDFAGGYQFATKSDYGIIVSKLIKSKSKKRLSQAALEALAIIAYRQPVSKPEIEQIRGVNSNEVVNSLIDKVFVKMIGRSEALGRPLLYGTTKEFLQAFGLKTLNDLPKLRELEELSHFDEDGDTSKDITFSVDANLEGSSFQDIDEQIEESADDKENPTDIIDPSEISKIDEINNN